MKSNFLKTLEGLEKKAESGPITLKQVFEEMGLDSHLVLILFLCLPFLQPIPLPGLSWVFGVLIGVGAWLKLLGKPAWLPKRFQAKLVKRELLLSLIRAFEKIWRYLERVLKPRWPCFFKHVFFRYFNGFVLISQAFLLSLPLPFPLTNNIPALVIVINVIGELEEDGLVVLISYILFALSLVFFGGLAFGIEQGWQLVNGH